jgi:hypothetical protein
MSHIFVSYSHKDTEYAHKLAQKLQSEGFDVWIDVRLDYGSQWPLEIQKQLDNCDAFILIMSPRSFASDWVQSELSRAKRKGKPIFPLLLEGDETWLSVESLQYSDVRGEILPDEKFYSALEAVVSRGPQTGQAPSAAPQKPAKPKAFSAPKIKTEIITAIIGGLATILAAVISVMWMNQSKDPVIIVPTTVSQATPQIASPLPQIIPTDTLEVVKAVPKPTSTPGPSISDFQACPSACNGQNSTNNFAAGITKIYFQFNYENFKSSIPYTRIWSMNGKEWIRYTCAWDGPASGTEPLKLTEPKGLASGTWEIKIIVDNEVLLEEEIVVVGNWDYWDPGGLINACHGTN